MALSHDELRNETRKGYDNIAPRYLEWTQPTFQWRLDYLQKVLTEFEACDDNVKEVNVLELGCGAGVPTTQALAAHPNFAVTANDISGAQIALAKERLPSSVKLIEGDMMSLEFPPGTFDLVVAMYAIIHLPRDDQVVLLHRLFNWLKPGGWFLANFAVEAVELASDPTWLGCTKGNISWSSWGAQRTCEILAGVGFDISVRELTKELEDAGEASFIWVIANKKK